MYGKNMSVPCDITIHKSCYMYINRNNYIQNISIHCAKKGETNRFSSKQQFASTYALKDIEYLHRQNAMNV